MLVGGSAGLAYALLPHRPLLWALAASILGLAITARLVAVAPPSHGQLADRLDGLSLPFFEQISERKSGHSWCRPHCPHVTRVYDAPDTAPFAALHSVSLALSRTGAGRPGPGVTKLRFARNDMTLDAEARRSPAGDVTVVIEVRGRRAS
jgi:hypothetical protein